jgi:hypothetical protein
MNNWCICWLFTHVLLEILIFKGLTARRLYKSFGVKELIFYWPFVFYVSFFVSFLFLLFPWKIEFGHPSSRGSIRVTPECRFAAIPIQHRISYLHFNSQIFLFFYLDRQYELTFLQNSEPVAIQPLPVATFVRKYWRVGSYLKTS